MECLLDESAVEGAAEVDATAASQSDRVAVILRRMVAVAVPMPKLGALRMSDAQRLIPELYEHIPAHLRGYVAHEVRLDDEVAADTERLAAFGGCAVRGMPLSLFPKFYLRFAGRIALYHYCKQKCPEEADEILKRCCFTTSTAASARSKYASMLRYYGGSAGVDAIFCHAAAEQGKRPPAEHPNASKRRRVAVSQPSRRLHCPRRVEALRAAQSAQTSAPRLHRTRIYRSAAHRQGRSS